VCFIFVKLSGPLIRSEVTFSRSPRRRASVGGLVVRWLSRRALLTGHERCWGSMPQDMAEDEVEEGPEHNQPG
jgi:hypothetical protein